MSTRSVLLLIAGVRFVSTTKGELTDLSTTEAKTPTYIAVLGSHRVLLTIFSLVGCNAVLLGKQF
jgi:hypothetical protein